MKRQKLLISTATNTNNYLFWVICKVSLSFSLPSFCFHFISISSFRNPTYIYFHKWVGYIRTHTYEHIYTNVYMYICMIYTEMKDKIAFLTRAENWRVWVLLLRSIELSKGSSRSTRSSLWTLPTGIRRAGAVWCFFFSEEGSALISPVIADPRAKRAASIVTYGCAPTRTTHIRFTASDRSSDRAELHMYRWSVHRMRPVNTSYC